MVQAHEGMDIHDLRRLGIIHIEINGRDYTFPYRSEIRYQMADANRYWGHLNLLELEQKSTGERQLVIGQYIPDIPDEEKRIDD